MELYNNLTDLILKRDDNKGIIFIGGENDEVYISYKEVYEKSLEVLYNMQAKGICQGSELVFQIENNYDFVLCFWACILGGIIPVPVTLGNNHEHRQKLFKILEILRNPYLLTDNKGAKVLRKSADDGMSLDKTEEITQRLVSVEDLMKSHGTGIVYKSSREDIALIQFSSGSTGDPKGVILTHHNLLTNIDGIISGTAIAKDESSLSWMPLTHDMGLIGFHLAPFAAGVNQYIMPTALFIRHPVLWLKKTHEHRINLLSSPNFGFKYFLEFYNPEVAGDWDLSCVRLIINGAEPISVDLCKKFLNQMKDHDLRSDVMFNVFGMAEASLAVTFPPLNEELASIKLDREFLFIGDSIKEVSDTNNTNWVEFADLGYPVKGCSVRISDEAGSVLGENKVGNIEIKGENVTSGYYNNEEATLNTIRTDGWLNTGDLGFLRNGRLIVTGRAKDVIFVNGQNYYAHDIERVSEQVRGIELGRVVACGVFNTVSQKDDIIILVLYKKKLIHFVELAVDLKKHIHSKIGLEVAHIIPVREIPKTTSGKIQRYKMAEMYQKGEYDLSIKELEMLLNEYDASHIKDTVYNGTEEKLAAICREVLHFNNIGRDDNIFEQGGDSLKASILVSKIHKHFNIQIALEDLYSFPTVRELAEFVDGAEKSQYRPIPTAKMNTYLSGSVDQTSNSEAVSSGALSSGEFVESTNSLRKIAYYVVSSAQKRVYALDRIEGSGTSYNIPAAMIIEGSLDVQKVEEVFKALVCRHEILRTSFEVIEGQPVQRVHEQVDFKVEMLYINEPEDSKAVVREKIDELAQKFIKPFDLSKAPLIRVGLVRISGRKHVLMLDMHHIISDGTSMGIMVKEFDSLFRGEKLQQLCVQYKDYAQWKNDNLVTESSKKEEEYWLRKFSGEIPVLSMPLDFQRPAVRSFEGDKIRFGFDKDFKDKLKKMALSKGVSLFTTLLAAYSVLLSKYSGQDDIIVGSPVAGRAHPDLENIIGMFVNTIPFRSFPTASKTFECFLEEVGKEVLKGFENQDYQFEQLLEKLNVKRDMSRNPIFDTMFVLQNMEIPEFNIEGLRFTNYEVTNKAAKFDITLEARENQEGIEFNLEYCTALFKRETMERFAMHFETILKQVVENPELEISAIDMLTKGEKKQILSGFNDTSCEYPMDKTISCVFEEQVEKIPDSVAVIFKNEKLTYSELNKRANSLARVLRQQGVKGDSIVAIMLERSIEMMVGILAVLKAGGAYLPISPEYPDERVKFMLEDSGAGILLTKHEAYGKQLQEEGEAACKVTVFDLEDDVLYSGDSSNLDEINSSRNLAYVIYTSGSTGKPKGAMIEHYSVINRINWMHKKYPIGKQDVILQKTPFTFDVSVWELFWWFFAGAKVCFLEPGGEKDPGAITEAIEKHKITTLHFVPSMLNMFLEYMEDEKNLNRISSLKQVFASGEALGTKQVQRFNRQGGLKFGTKLINLYGPTEATVDVSYYDCPSNGDIEIVPIGKSIDNIKLYIVDRYNNLQPVGIPGELCIAGDGLARGYLNRPELTAEKFVPDPFEKGDNLSGSRRMYRTGDLARWLPDGNIEYLGRLDHQVKVRGFRIELGEIEEELLKHESIKEAVVAARKDKDSSSYLCAYLVSERELTPAELREHLTKNLPEYMVPSYFTRLERLPLSPNGKVDRKALPEPVGNVVSGAEYIPPRNEIESKMARVWENVLNVPKVGINDDFFELGGDSIKAIQVTSLLSREGIDIEVKDILIYRTVSQICLNSDCKKSSLKYEQGVVQGSFGQTPVISWFFSKEFCVPDYYNQSVLLDLKKDISIEKLERTFKKIIAHHDGLRINYSDGSKELFYNNQHINMEFKVASFDISKLSPKDQERELESIGAQLKSGFDLAEGLLVKAALIDFGENNIKLLITIHHLAVDGVSWRIILEDIYSTYKALEEGREAILPAKTASMKQWYEKLVELSESPKVLGEKEYWLGVDKVKFELPADFEIQNYNSGLVSRVKGSLDKNETEKLLKEANKAYNTSVEELLITALAKTINEWTDQNEIVIEMENHGRNVDGIDVLRTVGWFTAIYPLKLEIIKGDLGEQIMKIKEQIRSVPGDGIGYGILKYLCGVIPESDKLVVPLPLHCSSTRPRLAEVRLNYLGCFDKEADNDIFGYSLLNSGSDISAANSITAKLEINCMVVNDSFELDINFSNKIFKEETLLDFRDKYLKNLKDIISFTATNEDVFFTPSDFETLDIGQDDLDALFE